MLKLSIHKEVSIRVPATRIKRLFDLVAEEEAAIGACGHVNLVFTDDNRLRLLNREFRSRDKTTDVLSFNIDEPDDPEAVLGEIYISVPFARRQAEGYGGTAAGEFLRLICHGLLHLFGYDHQGEADSRAMERRHEHFLNRLSEMSGTTC
ncbi:MAG: rRNA maturation RNase YbeY [bacterium]|nr:rRNA maturation RNase YbeY [bacterium]